MKQEMDLPACRRSCDIPLNKTLSTDFKLLLPVNLSRVHSRLGPNLRGLVSS